MAIKKTKTGWQADIRPGGGRGRRIRKTFRTKGEAKRFIAWIETEHIQGREWNPGQQDNRRLLELVASWYHLHGRELQDSKGRRRKLECIAIELGNPIARHVTAEDFTRYRARRLESGVTASTVNHEHAYLRGMFNELRRLGDWKGDNPVAGIRQIRVRERELTYLTSSEIQALLVELRKADRLDAYHVARICLATGARWSEAETLEADQVKADRIVFVRTKGGRVRTVPVDPELLEEVKTTNEGRLFRSCYYTFRGAVKRAGLELPRGQLAHVLRHTFASHFIMNGGNLLTLQRILGHTDIHMTMRYAHLAPDHLTEAREFNPLCHGVQGVS
ncbi:phage integrase [Arhodomonas sp. SL1]|uniref:phage integrase n=1 Tax=Arhodomonas sp. SL1 TaxID=3425691 RepID=UPI003F8854E3